MKQKEDPYCIEADVFGYVRRYYYHLESELQQAKAEGNDMETCAISTTMMVLRDVGRFILHPVADYDDYDPFHFEDGLAQLVREYFLDREQRLQRAREYLLARRQRYGKAT
jgi:hypothetical protein